MWFWAVMLSVCYTGSLLGHWIQLQSDFTCFQSDRLLVTHVKVFKTENCFHVETVIRSFTAVSEINSTSHRAESFEFCSHCVLLVVIIVISVIKKEHLFCSVTLTKETVLLHEIADCTCTHGLTFVDRRAARENSDRDTLRRPCFCSESTDCTCDLRLAFCLQVCTVLTGLLWWDHTSVLKLLIVLVI